MTDMNSVLQQITKLLLTPDELAKVKLGPNYRILIATNENPEAKAIYSSQNTNQVCDENGQITKIRSLKVFQEGGFQIELKSSIDEANQRVAQPLCD